MNSGIRIRLSQIPVVILIGVTVFFQAHICRASSADSAGLQTQEIYKVAVRDSPPFIIMDGQKVISGLSVSLWQAIVNEHTLRYEYKKMGLAETIAALEAGTIDIAISPLTITKDRERLFDFSAQYFPSGLTFASIASKKININYALNSLKEIVLSPPIFAVLIIFLILFGIYFVLSLLYFNDYCGDEIGQDTRAHRKFFSLFIISFFMTSGIDQTIFRFRSIVMQLLSLILVLFGLTISASIFGLVTATLTQSINYQPQFDLQTIAGKNIAVLEGSTADKFLTKSRKKAEDKAKDDNPTADADSTGKTTGAETKDDSQSADDNITRKQTVQETINALLNGRVDLVLGDWAQLTYWANEDKRIFVQNSFMKFEPYGWGFPQNSPIREDVNSEMIYLIRQKDWWTNKVKRQLGRVVFFSTD